MLKRALKLLESNENDQANDEKTLAAATAELLLEIGRADFDVGPEELEGIVNVLKSQFRLSEEEARLQLESSRRDNRKTVSIHPLTRLINEHADEEQKAVLVEQLWDVAYADNRIDKHEEHQIRRIAELLYVPHHQFIRAKLNAQARANTGK